MMKQSGSGSAVRFSSERRPRLAVSVGLVAFGAMLLAAVSPLAAQNPVLSNIESPYPALQSSVHMVGVQYGPGAVAYGPAGTPLELTGSFGDQGSVLFPGSARGTTAPAAVSIWTSTTIFLTVPAGATTGLVTVVSNGKSSNGLPFMVTPGAYSGSCPTYRSSSQLEITTDALPDGTVHQSYSTTLNASGGTPPYSWSISGNSLPAGLSFSSSSGAISGTPSAAQGPVSLTLTATDSHQQAVNVTLDLTIDPLTLSPAQVYSYVVPSGGYDSAGNILQYQDSVNGTWNFGYDALNRLTSAIPGAGANSSYSGQNLCMAYDGFGNRTASGFQSSSCPSQESSLPATMPYTTRNQINSGLYSYDASGNLTSESNQGTSFLYDAEGRVCAVQSTPVPGMTQTIGYIYDPEGERVAKGTITTMSCDPSTNGFKLTVSYVRSAGGESLTALGPDGDPLYSNVNGAGKQLVSYDTVGTHYQVEDPLGSRRLQTDAQAVPEMDFQNLPFGDGLQSFPDPSATSPPDDSNPFHFTGKERDAESGNDYFGARYYASTMGRFLSPDWSAKEEPVPYAKLDDPQSLNLYAYVGNNPLSRVDKDGHSTLVYDGNSHTITFYDKNGNEIGHWEAHNNVAIHAPKGEGFQGHFTHGPIQNGTYSIRGADQKGGKQHVGEPANGPFGSKGIVHMNHAKSASGATVEDDGVHAGRQATSTHDQSESLTGGCIRTTPEAMGAIQTTAPKDPLQSITVTNNQQNVQQWQKQAKAAGDKIQ